MSTIEVQVPPTQYELFIDGGWSPSSTGETLNARIRQPVS